MEDAGLSVRVDACGTIIGRLEGEDPNAACVMTGSHFDSVRCGGNFDGQEMCIRDRYSPTVQRFSIDECFADLAGCAEDAADAAHTAYIIKERIKKELGFTVNVGVGSNKLLAKMAGELQKPRCV